MAPHRMPALPNFKDNDYAAIARGMGLERVFRVSSIEKLERDFPALKAANAPGHTFVVLEVEPFSDEEQKTRAAAVRRSRAEIPLRSAP